METEVLNDILDDMDFNDIIRTFHPNAKEYTIVSSAHGTLSRTDHNLDHKKTSVNSRKLKLYQASFLTTRL